ncbi:MAG: nicotinamide-nucleotide adenylyltransferase [Thermoplasmata archaeon]|nr:nicotinamide-nucleotide adenylyltransferase [Thermoplasmata archaeon]
MPLLERGLLVGRFQPLHRGHLDAIAKLRASVPEAELIVGIGSAQHSYTLENPFTAGERMEMLLRAIEEAGLTGVRPIPLVDIDRHAEWVAYVESLLPGFGRVYTNNPLTRLLFEAAGYAVEEVPWSRREEHEGRLIRRELAAGDAWKSKVPPSVAAYLTEIRGPERLRLLSSKETGSPSHAKGDA